MPDRNSVVYGSTKTYTHSVGLSCAFRQWRADTHCQYIHGYALKVKLTFEGDLDEKHWVVNFGGLKSVKAWLEQKFDHKLLVTNDDPFINVYRNLDKLDIAQVMIVDAMGIEAFAGMVWDHVNLWIKTNSELAGRDVSLTMVEVSEHEGNSAYVRSR